LHLVDIKPRLSSLLLHGIKHLGPTYVCHTFLNGSFGPGSDFAGWDEIPPVLDGSLKAAGAQETSAVRCVELDGAGVWFVSFRKSRFRPSSAEWRLMARVQREITLAHRLRRKLSAPVPAVSMADAILDSSGHVLHAAGRARDPAEREALTNAVRRGKTVACSSESQTWILVDGDRVGEAGRVLAFTGQPMPPGLKLLSSREREVVGRALARQTNKEIAYELGLADATVRVLMLRATRKLGARTRGELLRMCTAAASSLTPMR
jgi:DNA-binding CsgD family transcriptional regulator